MGIAQRQTGKHGKRKIELVTATAASWLPVFRAKTNRKSQMTLIDAFDLKTCPITFHHCLNALQNLLKKPMSHVYIYLELLSNIKPLEKKILVTKPPRYATHY